MQNLKKFILNLELPKKIKISFFLFSKKEWIIFWFFLALLLLSTIGILKSINNHFIVDIPISGGTLKEGMIGSPRFINPILAFSDTDKDVSSIIYSGLTRKDSTGKIIPDLALNYTISEDYLSYTFVLKDKIYFHDGKKITADDIIFTIESIKNPENKSPYKGNWDGVSIEKIDEQTIKFNLKQPYSSFLESTTLGILPKHVWENSIIELNDRNINPVGSGPFKIKKISKENSGIVKSYELEKFKKFSLQNVYINNLQINFYSNESELLKALENGYINQAGYITPEKAKDLIEKKYNIISTPLPRVFGLFYNQSQNQIFTNKKILEAIDLLVDKEKIIEEVFFGFGTKINNPIPINLKKDINKKENKTKFEDNFLKAEEILKKDGWKKDEEGYLYKETLEGKIKSKKYIEFDISTSNATELSKTAEIIKENLNKAGFKVEVKTFEIGNLNQLVIKPRKYDMLLFGQIVNSKADLYAFWHSSQRKDPGLNIAIYTNSKVDKILEEAYTETDTLKRESKYDQFEEEVQKEKPAIFIYSPNYIYVIAKNLKGVNFDNLISPQDRFSEIYNWYLKTEKVWKFFAI